MTVCNKKIFPCKGTFSAITLERLVRSRQDFQGFAAIHADVALDMNLQIRFFRDFRTRLPNYGQGSSLVVNNSLWHSIDRNFALSMDLSEICTTHSCHYSTSYAGPLDRINVKSSCASLQYWQAFQAGKTQNSGTVPRYASHPGAKQNLIHLQFFHIF